MFKTLSIKLYSYKTLIINTFLLEHVKSCVAKITHAVEAMSNADAYLFAAADVSSVMYQLPPSQCYRPPYKPRASALFSVISPVTGARCFGNSAVSALSAGHVMSVPSSIPTVQRGRPAQRGWAACSNTPVRSTDGRGVSPPPLGAQSLVQCTNRSGARPRNLGRWKCSGQIML